MARVVVVGSLNVDRTWRVARHPMVGETILGEVLAPGPGGKGLNQAVAAARMGVPVRLVGLVGADDDGRFLVGVAAAEGIDVDAVGVDPEAPTGAALIVVADDGANTVTVAPGANLRLAVDGETVGLRSDDVVVAQLEVPVVAIVAAFDAARAVGARTVLNPSPVREGGSLVERADVVIVNQSEAAELTGSALPRSAPDAIDRARRIARDGQVIVVTLGADGAVAVGPAPGDAIEVVGAAVATVDTTGAGDCFGGVLAAGLAQRLDLGPAVERANRAAAISTTRPGTVASMPTAVEITSSS